MLKQDGHMGLEALPKSPALPCQRAHGRYHSMGMCHSHDQTIANQFALASGRKKAEGCRASWLGFSLHKNGDCLFGLTHVRTDLQYNEDSSWAQVVLQYLEPQ